MSVLVIAEPGGTAQGDYATMVRLLETAHACGANIWKPQWVSSAERHIQRRTARLNVHEAIAFRAKYERAYSWLQWPVEWHEDFRDRCHAIGMQYACSVCLPEDVAAVDPFVDCLKVGSFEAEDDQIRGACCSFSDKPCIVSLGMLTITDTRRLRLLWPGKTKWLHCVSAYPTPMRQMNIATVRGDARDVQHGFLEPCDGLSDHSRHILAGALAVACGASMVEAHYRLDDCDTSNPDYAVSFAPDEFRQYIRNIRDAELMLGDGIKRIHEAERAMLKFKVGANG